MPRNATISRKLPVTFYINIGVIAISVYLYLLTLDYPGMSGTFPRLVLIMTIGVAIADIINIFSRKKTSSAALELQAQDSAAPMKNQGKVFYLAILMFVFFAFLQLLGVILGTFSFILLSGWTLGYKKFLNLSIASIIIAASVYLIFVVIMDCFLPQGILIRLIGG